MEEINLEGIVAEAQAATEETEFQLATIGAVTASGIKLIFDGTTSATDKEYKVNTAIKFSAGDRVKVTKESGSYIVDFIVGTPMSNYPIPAGGTMNQVLMKSSSDDYALTWGSVATFPSTGTNGQYLRKKTGGVEWADPIPETSSSTYGKFLTNTRDGIEWGTPTVSGTLPSGGSSGQFLKKSSNADYQCTWATITEYTGPTIKGTGTSSLGFYGQTAVSRQTVNKASTSATLAQLITAHNNLWTAIKSLGLITGY